MSLCILTVCRHPPRQASAVLPGVFDRQGGVSDSWRTGQSHPWNHNYLLYGRPTWYVVSGLITERGVGVYYYYLNWARVNMVMQMLSDANLIYKFQLMGI